MSEHTVENGLRDARHLRCGSCGEQALHFIVLNGFDVPACLRHLNVWKSPDFATESAARAKPAPHGVAWEDKLNIVCVCGEVCSAVVRKSPARLMGSTSDTYIASPAAEAFARHLREQRTGTEPTSVTAPGLTDTEAGEGK